MPASPFTIGAVHFTSFTMPDRLLLRLAFDGGLTWLRQGDGSRAVSSMLGAPPASVLAGAAQIVVLVPGEDVLLTQTRLTARNRVQLMQALPFAIEDQLLAPVEELHFAASFAADERIGVAVVARTRMRQWLDHLATAGVRPDVLMPDTLALPSAPERATMLVEADRISTRLAPWSAFVCSPAELPGWLARIASSGALPALEVHDFRAAPPLALPIAAAKYLDRQHDPLAFLAASLGAPALNLLDGEFATRHRRARGQRRWRVAAALAATVALLAVADLGSEVLRLSRLSARIDALEQDAVREAFPDIDAAQLARLSPQQLMRGRLDRLAGSVESSGLLRVLTQIGPVLGTTTRIQMRGMEYRNGTLEIALRAPDVAALDSVRERMAMVPGLKAEVTAANSGADGVDGRIRIVGADSSGGSP